MNGDGWDLFISYAREDQAWVKVLAENLHQLGFEVFFDEWEVGPGSVVALALEEGLKRSRCGVVVVSPAALERPWVLEEYAAMVSATVSRGMRLVPVLYREAEMPAMLSTRRWVDFREKVGKGYLQALDELAAGLRGGSTEKRPPRGSGLRSPAPALVRGSVAAPIEVAEPVAVRTYRAWLAKRAAKVEMVGVAGGEMELDLEAIYVALRATPQDFRASMPGSDGVRERRRLWPGRAAGTPGDANFDNAGATVHQQVIVLGRASVDPANDDEHADEHAYEHACQEPEAIDVETVFRGSPTRHALILGHPGSGKTTALRKILFSVRDDATAIGLTTGTVPVWLPLRRFAGLAGRGIAEWIGDELAIADKDAPLDRELGPALWRHGRLLLLADGLDEVACEAKRRDLCKYLDTSLLLARDARAIVSSRYTGYRREVRLPRTFSAFELQPLDDRQVEELVTRWFEEAPKAMPTVSAGTSRERGAQLCEALRGPLFRHQRRGVMKSSPLLLTLMCVIENAGLRMPESRVEFYKRCLDVLLTRRGKESVGAPPVDLPGAAVVVQRLAYALHSAGERDDLPRSTLTRAALDQLQRSGRKPRLAREVIRWLLEHTGILREFAAEHLGFFHLGMQEYLTAAYVAEVRGKPLDMVIDAITGAHTQERSWWHEVTRLMVALPSAGMFATLCERLLAQDRGWARHRELVHDWIEEAPAPDPGPFVAHLRGGVDVSEMIAGLGVLDRFAGDEAVRALATELSGAEDEHVQKMAQRLLTRHHEETRADSPAAAPVAKGARPQPLALLFREGQRERAERLARALEVWCPLLRDDDGALVEASRLAQGMWFDRVADATAGVIVLADGSGLAFEGPEGIEDALVIWAGEGRSLYGAWAGGAPPRWPTALVEAGAAPWDDVTADGGAALGKRIAALLEGESASSRTGIVKGSVFVEPVTGIRALAVPAGRYRMGMSEVRLAEPVRWVRMSAFWLGETPVTNLQYARFLEANPEHRPPRHWKDGRFEGDTRPVVGVSWDDAVAFCTWLYQLAPVRSSGLRPTLPSEAQWEFAARGEDGRSYPWGEALPTDRLAVFRRRERGLTTAPVSSCPEGVGPFGHLDLAGNVWEWCRDVWNEEGYSLRDEDAEDPVNEVGDSDRRPLRGSSWRSEEPWAAAGRIRLGSWLRGDYFGFRVGFEPAGLAP